MGNEARRDEMFAVGEIIPFPSEEAKRFRQPWEFDDEKSAYPEVWVEPGEPLRVAAVKKGGYSCVTISQDGTKTGGDLVWVSAEDLNA